METSTVLGVLTDKSGGKGEEGGGLGLGFGFAGSHHHHHEHPQKMIRTDTFPFRVVSASTVPPPSLPSHNSSGGGAGPTFFCNNGICDVYDGARTLKPFASPCKSPGMGGAATLQRYPPFTAVQWQELQRQALIYKYIMASTPVPPELLFTPRVFSDAPILYSNMGPVGGYFNLRFSGNATDPEPGRCRRTDGKKWRCSRDVAPDQKYCERHLHRGRPRSRKPVEHEKIASTAAATASAATAATTSAHANHTTAAAAALSNLAPKPCPQASSGSLFPKPEMKLPFQSMIPPREKEARHLDWMKGEAEEMMANQQWQMLYSKPVLQHYDDHFNLNYTDLNDQQCCPFLNPNISSSLEEVPTQAHREPPRRFIDAWSRETLSLNAPNNHEDNNININSSIRSSVSSVGNLSPSNLTLSMSGGGGGLGEDPCQIHKGLGINDSAAKSQPLTWTNPASPLGGPLAEVLQSRTTVASCQQHDGCDGGEGVVKRSCAGLINLMSRSCCGAAGNEGMSPRDSPARPVSSPTGVLQRTLVSLSDSSSNGSPTPFGSSTSRSDAALQWMCHLK